ncbi:MULTISPECIES: XRE family transcriptional regulator [Rhizobium]|uniref:Transcriptional regulator protein n=3 Tax=Rhizobium TaxID=379 RepID=A0A1L5PAZ8_RHIET|nr:MULTISPECIES: XRE family transcriptional regulator [Rhizobium]EGE55267.1 transcriptional regulator [Rhizobium etli CNPAF512]APO77329.1 transcriptional regulator protein [Rhizobium etli 8C-3]MBB4332707.1 hypothetical protein [Rhizobium leguminosarum]MBB4358264.1 hypothetical protein [Rhizobium leguminosarum]MBB4510807.1 hypothetical protein [Rhizobium leguminosarum]
MKRQRQFSKTWRYTSCAWPEKTQQDLARALYVKQPAVAKLEQRGDIYVSSLRRYMEALGGTFEITAKFPDASVNI